MKAVVELAFWVEEGLLSDELGLGPQEALERLPDWELAAAAGARRMRWAVRKLDEAGPESLWVCELEASIADLSALSRAARERIGQAEGPGAAPAQSAWAMLAEALVLCAPGRRWETAGIRLAWMKEASQ